MKDRRYKKDNSSVHNKSRMSDAMEAVSKALVVELMEHTMTRYEIMTKYGLTDGQMCTLAMNMSYHYPIWEEDARYGILGGKYEE